MSYSETVRNWHDFYVTAGAAAATLVGLLFVGLTLHIRVVVTHPDVRSLARVTLMDFFIVLLITLSVLTPTSDARETATWLIAIAAVSLGLVLRPVLQGLKSTQTMGLRVLISRFGLSALCYFGVGAMGVLFGGQHFENGLLGLRVLVVFLLVVAVRNTWDLLVVVADRPEAGLTRQAGSREPDKDRADD
jgi:hypothetical protein